MNLRAAPRPTVYVPFFEKAPSDGILVIRARGSLAEISSAVRKELQPMFPKTPLAVQALTEQVEHTIVRERLIADLATGFAVLGLVLACVGLYGLLAYTVVRRTREIGIRMALGAGKRGVLWMVTSRVVRLMGLGVVAGLPMAALLSRWVQSMLYGVNGTDPGIIVVAVLLLIAAGVVAAFFPARRAASVDPTNALRHE